MPLFVILASQARVYFSPLMGRKGEALPTSHGLATAWLTAPDSSAAAGLGSVGRHGGKSIAFFHQFSFKDVVIALLKLRSASDAFDKIHFKEHGLPQGQRGATGMTTTMDKDQGLASVRKSSSPI